MPPKNRHFQQILDRHTKALDYNDTQLPLPLVREISPDSPDVDLYFGRHFAERFPAVQAGKR